MYIINNTYINLTPLSVSCKNEDDEVFYIEKKIKLYIKESK